MSTCLTGAGILVVGPEQVVQALRGSCGPGQTIDRVDDAFAALERLAGANIAATFVWTASLPSRAAAALAAMRQLLSAEGKLFLIARPDEEPQVRRLLDSGADDYLIWPVQACEASRVLGVALSPPPKGKNGPAAYPAAGWETASPGTVAEVGALIEVLRYAETDLNACLDRLASLVCESLRARGCTVEVSDLLSVCGEAVGDPVLSAQFDLGGGQKGTLAVGPRRSGTYAAGDAGRLEIYAAAAGLVCRMARAARLWQHEAMTDELTGLYNRRGLMLRLPEILDAARRQRTPVTLLLFDIDNFKHYNDAYGHNVGDEILRETGKLFSRHTRKHDIVARYGGDEFVVVFWESDEPRKAGSKPPRDVLAVLSRFRRSLERHEFRSLGPEAQGVLTISGGLVTFPWDAGTPEELVLRADEALLLAKRQGKNRIWLIGQGPQ